MLSYLLGIIQEFERDHGRRPQLICLNQRHLHQLMAECPDLFDSEAATPLGFRILVLPDTELAHPKAVWLPPRMRTLPRQPRVSSALLARLHRYRHTVEKS